MFGRNPILSAEHNGGMTLRVVGKPWKTVQGEGPYAGHPATFIRLHGCNLACTFCDTEFSDPNDPIVSVHSLITQCINNNSKLVVITGGEPFRQDILVLCSGLASHGMKVQIETAGTLWIDGIHVYAEIVCSPKTPKIHPKIYQHASAFKYVIDAAQQFDGFIPITATQAGARSARLAAPRPGAPVFLSPMDVYDDPANTANRKLVGELAIKYNCIAGIQLHKFLGVD